METYILILYTEFENDDDALRFCTEIFPHEKVENSKFILESPKNIIIRFESKKKNTVISKELYKTLNITEINVYFLIKLKDFVAVYLPIQLKSFLYDDDENDESDIMAPLKKIKQPEDLNVNRILSKIKKDGISSITPDELDFLDNFNK